MTFTVPGDPVPAARPRVVRGRAFTPTRTREHVEYVRLYAAKHCQVQLIGSVRLEVDFYRKNKRRTDLDNLVKGVQDAMLPYGNWPGVYRDDSQITTLIARKYHDPENPRTVVTVTEDFETWDGEP